MLSDLFGDICVRIKFVVSLSRLSSVFRSLNVVIGMYISRSSTEFFLLFMSRIFRTGYDVIYVSCEFLFCFTFFFLVVCSTLIEIRICR